MTSLENLAYLRKSRQLANQSKRQILCNVDLFSENRQAYFAAKQMSSLVGAARFAESQLRIVYGELLLPAWLKGLSSLEREVFLSHYNDRQGFYSIAEDHGTTNAVIVKQWRTALKKILSNIAPIKKQKLDISFAPSRKSAVPGKGNWYVVQVATGREEAVAHSIRMDHPNFINGAIATSTRVVTLSAKGYRENYEVAIKGYIFVQAYELTAEAYHWIMGITNVVRVLNMNPLSKDEVRVILGLCNIEKKARLKCTEQIRALLKERCLPYNEIIMRGQQFFQFSLDLLQGIFKEIPGHRGGPPPPLIEDAVRQLDYIE
ncbi:MAG: hypothetical protein HPY50_02195 [Firmicutes bacterium]|nr:hypothetical protein [Bacillota bacterium]